MIAKSSRITTYLVKGPNELIAETQNKDSAVLEFFKAKGEAKQVKLIRKVKLESEEDITSTLIVNSESKKR